MCVLERERDRACVCMRDSVVCMHEKEIVCT